MHIEKFDKKNLQELRGIINDAIRGELERRGITGVTFAAKNASYTPDGVTVTYKLEGNTEGRSAADDKFLEEAMEMFGIENRESSSGARLVAYLPKSSKYPFVFEREGKRYKTSARGARAQFGNTGKGIYNGLD